LIGVLALCWLLCPRLVLARSGIRVRQGLRAVTWATAATVCVHTSLIIAAGVAVAMTVGAHGAQRVLGAILLAAPNIVAIVMPLGIGAPWTVEANGPLASRLAPTLERTLGGSTVSLDSLSQMTRPVWLVPVAFAATALLSSGVVAALLSRRAVDERGPVARALARAAWLGIVVALTMGIAAMVGTMSMAAGISLLAFDMAAAFLEIDGAPEVAVALGLAGGTLAGFVGSLIADLLRSHRP
jgi:hypothetical protein